MERRHFIKQTVGAGIALHPLVRGVRGMGVGPIVGPKRPVFVYNNWSAYDELSDKVVQTEVLAMRELGEMLRLRDGGVRLDYYVMDAFWFDKMGGYRTWHREHWPNGPDKWLADCREHGIRPGMWFSTNLIATHDGRFLEPVAEWKDSIATDPNILCLFEGGYLAHLADTLQLWYDRGVRLFKFDFAYFEAVTPASKSKFTLEEIKEKNKTAFMGMLRRFRVRNPDVLITGYNGFGGEMENTFLPFRKTVDERWLEVFDTLYCGDPRFSDVPMMNIWRSQDNYSDHMVRQFAFNGLPVRRIDNCAFMIGTTGTCYYRATHAWKGMLILELARGGWMNVYHGNLELLNADDARWFARVQRLYEPLQRADGISVFGAVPGESKPYGFSGRMLEGMVYTVVNPSQEVAEVELPSAGVTRVLYADGGFVPTVKNGRLRMGTEQLVVVGVGAYASEQYALGTDDTVRIPLMQERVDVRFESRGKNRVGAMVNAVKGKGLRILFQQYGSDGLPRRSWGGAPPDGKKMNELLRIRVRQGGAALPLAIENDKMIWSGLSWAAGELTAGTFDAALPLDVECVSAEQDELRLEARVYAVEY
ncbi:hypothetical protein [Puia dinghuensis]|uniref:Uncharacterized protein n=1 Tax=Puia dinghuensis TaxID=1792502 RepID=A0A8J2UH64_9BACT|nr:hypothetical protein [Puia dinghuensis]GGB17504.1 hypothetical protein GCM10011511_46620 [Puia dinghuensis]